MNLFSAMLSALAAALLYACSAVFYRLFLSPISAFPGPKLAAATFWYEFYYDIILGGKYIWKIKALHEQYGPVIRINPEELHVVDPAFWDVMYTASTNTNRRDKPARQAKGTGLPLSMIGAVPHALHRARRAALSPFFSMQNIRRLLPRIQERVDALVNRLQECAVLGEVVMVEHAYAAFTNDVVMQYSFGRSDHHIEAPDFDPKFFKMTITSAATVPLLKHFNWLVDVMQHMPDWMAVKMSDEFSTVVVLKNRHMRQIKDIRSQGPQSQKDGTESIFHQLLLSDLTASEKESGRLIDEAVLLIGAGTNTGSWTLTVLTFHLLSQPDLLRRLKTELKAAGPNPPLSALEKLPFLTAVIKEGQRLAYGISARSARVAPDAALRCGTWTIPPGTAVSMTAPLTHHDPRIFADPDSFLPDRWLDPVAAAELNRFFVPFSKGSRSCLGMNLAWVELYLCTAAVFGHFGSGKVKDEGDVGVMELFETDETDVKMESDMFLPVVRKGSKGVMVKFSLV